MNVNNAICVSSQNKIKVRKLNFILISFQYFFLNIAKREHCII